MTTGNIEWSSLSVVYHKQGFLERLQTGFLTVSNTEYCECVTSEETGVVGSASVALSV